jgi:hypothetical protein
MSEEPTLPGLRANADRDHWIARILRMEVGLRLGLRTAHELPTMARDLVSEGVDLPAVVALAAHEPLDEREDVERSFSRVLEALGLVPEADVVLAAKVLRDELARDVLEGRLAPLDGGERLWSLQHAVEQATQREGRDPLGLLALVCVVDEAFWDWDARRPREVVERGVLEECARLLSETA